MHFILPGKACRSKRVMRLFPHRSWVWLSLVAEASVFHVKFSLYISQMYLAPFCFPWYTATRIFRFLWLLLRSLSPLNLFCSPRCYFSRFSFHSCIHPSQPDLIDGNWYWEDRSRWRWSIDNLTTLSRHILWKAFEIRILHFHLHSRWHSHSHSHLNFHLLYFSIIPLSISAQYK